MGFIQRLSLTVSRIGRKLVFQPKTVDESSFLGSPPGESGEVDCCVKVCRRPGVFAGPGAVGSVLRVEIAGRSHIGVGDFAAFIEKAVQPVAVLPV